MIPAQFDYVAPASVEEALQALAQHGDEAKIIAGGQSLLPVLRMRLNAPEVVIDIGRIDSLRGIRDDGDAVVIGAMTTHHDVVNNALVREHALLITKAAAEVADAQIRHRGTFGGALAHADPAGDLGAPALALGAEFVIAGPGGTRTVAADDFFVDLFETAIGEDEILTEVRIPKHTGWGAHYEKFVRVSHQWPIVAVAATVKADGGCHLRGADRADQHGFHGPARAWCGGGPGRRDGVRGRRTRGSRQGGRRHEPAVRPQRLRGVPEAPRQGAHQASCRGGGRRLMQLTHRFTVPVPIDEAWAHFNDIGSVAECFPGASVTSAEGDSFAGSVKVKLGPIALVYNGTGLFTEKDEAAHRMVVDASGKDKRGNGTAGAAVVMTMTEAGTSTDVEVVTDLAITGKPAQFGRGVMQDVSDKLLGQFVACLEQRFDSPAAAAETVAEPAPPAAEPEPEPEPEPTPTLTDEAAPAAVEAPSPAPTAAGTPTAEGRPRRPGPRRHGVADPGQVLLEAGPRRARRAGDHHLADLPPLTRPGEPFGDRASHPWAPPVTTYEPLWALVCTHPRKGSGPPAVRFAQVGRPSP